MKKLTKEEEKQIEKQKEYLRDVLLMHAGKGNEITSKEVAKLLGLDEDDTCSGTRALIKACAYEYHIPLAANMNGYFVIENADEMREYCQNLNFRASEILRRKEVIEGFYREREAENE